MLLLLTRAPIARRDLTAPAPQAGPASMQGRNLPSPSRNGPFCARIAQLQGLFSPCGAFAPAGLRPVASSVGRAGEGRRATKALSKIFARGNFDVDFLDDFQPPVGNNLQDGLSRRAAAL